MKNKFWGANKVHYGRCASGVLQFLITVSLTVFQISFLLFVTFDTMLRRQLFDTKLWFCNSQVTFQVSYQKRTRNRHYTQNELDSRDTASPKSLPAIVVVTFAASFKRELKQRRFWATRHVDRKWAFFSFDMPWLYKICIAKCPHN